MEGESYQDNHLFKAFSNNWTVEFNFNYNYMRLKRNEVKDAQEKLRGYIKAIFALTVQSRDYQGSPKS